MGRVQERTLTYRVLRREKIGVRKRGRERVRREERRERGKLGEERHTCIRGK